MRTWTIIHRLLTVGVCAWWVGFALSASAATGSGGGQVFKVTVTTVEISSDAGSTYTTLFSGSQEMDIAAANAGAVAAGLVSGVQLPAATYNRIRVTIGSALKVKGYVNISGTTYYTNGTSFASASGNDNPPSSGFVESTFTVPQANRTSTETVSLVVTPTGSSKVQVAFDTSGVLINDGTGNPTLGPPVVKTTAQ